LKKLKFIMSAVMLTACMSAFIGASGATAFAYEGEQEPVAECAHEYTEEVVEGTCTTKGYTRYTCTLCGDTYTDNYTEVNGHKFGEIVIEPTCTHRGYTIHYCKECGYEYSDSYVPATGHAYVIKEENGAFITVTEERALSALREVYSEYAGTKVLCAGYAVKISLSGAGMQGKAGVAARLLKCLWREDLRVYGISNSEIKISVLVAEEYADAAMRSILGEFELDV